MQYVKIFEILSRKKVQNSHFSEFKYSLLNLLKSSTAEIMVYMTRTHGFYSIYTNVQWNNCHFPTQLVQMFQMVNVWNFVTIHHLLQCSPICFSRTERRHIVHATVLLTCTQMCRSSLNRKTGCQTARILIRLIMQFDGHCSRWCIVAKFQTLTSWNVCLSTVGLS